MVLAGVPRSVTDRLQRVLKAVARLVSGRANTIGADESFTCRLALARCGRSGSVQSRRPVHRCLHNKAPNYLRDCCIAVSDIAGRQRLRSAHRHQLAVPRYQRSTLGRRAFSVAGPTVWNSLPDELRDEHEDMFRKSLKTLFFGQY